MHLIRSEYNFRERSSEVKLTFILGNLILTDTDSIPPFEVRYGTVRLQLHGAIYRPDSFVLMSRHCANLKAIRYESTSLNRIVADKSHSVIVALEGNSCSSTMIIEQKVR